MTRHYPWLTFLVLLPAIALLPGRASEWFQYDRTLAGDPAQAWRFVTSQWTHWSASHLFWDGITMLILGIACERTSRTRTAWAIGVSAILVPVAVHAWQPGIAQFRGLSGVCCAAFGLLLARLAIDAESSATTRGVVAVAMTAFVVKTGIELATGQAVFAGTRGEFVVVPLAHLVGFGVGVATGIGGWIDRGRVPKMIGPIPRGSR
jgi:rhomboid family GlyGly-CTERM serine protease